MWSCEGSNWELFNEHCSLFNSYEFIGYIPTIKKVFEKTKKKKEEQTEYQIKEYYSIQIYLDQLNHVNNRPVWLIYKILSRPPSIQLYSMNVQFSLIYQ